VEIRVAHGLGEQAAFAGPCANQAQSSFGIRGCIMTAAAHAPTDTTIAKLLMTIHIMSAPIADRRKVLPAWCSKFVTIGVGMGRSGNKSIHDAVMRRVFGNALVPFTER
jgi:hypothetical protein